MHTDGQMRLNRSALGPTPYCHIICFRTDTQNKNGRGSADRLEFNKMTKRNRVAPMSDPPKYPDISDLIARKAKGRINIKQLSFGEKIELMEELRRRLAPLKALRKERRQDRNAS
jgi:hypothetical protein